MSVDVPEPEITEIRRAVMARIKSSDTKPEILLRKALWALGARYRLGTRIGRLKPDLVFKKARVAVYVDGCFWHGCPEHYTPPRSRWQFWADKLRENVERDLRQTKTLTEDGWHVLRSWEHEVISDPVAVALQIQACLEATPHPANPDRYHVISAAPKGETVLLDLVSLLGTKPARTISRALITPKPRAPRK